MDSKLHDDIKNCLEQLVSDAGGGCPLDKALIMADYIVRENITYSVEIGVYKGRSFFPQAIAHLCTGGRIIGIDPFLKAAAREKDVSPQLKEMIDGLIDSWDIVGLYAANLEKITQWNLGNRATIFRETSETAMKYIPNEIGMLHIDGNHDIAFVSKDILLYLPKMKQRGLIVMDDTDWASVKSCLHLLSDNGCVQEKVFDTWQVWRKQ